MIQSEMRKPSIPLQRYSQPPECGTTAVLEQGTLVHLCSGGTLHMDEAHHRLVLNLQCALLQVIFFSVITSFEKLL
jgi:hypothetical protein